MYEPPLRILCTRTVGTNSISFFQPFILETTLENGVFMTFGCHPKRASYYLTNGTDLEMTLNLYLRFPRCVAVGEIGLDFSAGCETPAQDQLMVFKHFLRKAKGLGKPVCLHVRDAAAEAEQAMFEAGLPTDWPIHMHCFADELPTYLRWKANWPNMMFGFTPYGRSAIIRQVPLEHVLLETDAPYFLPGLDGVCT